MQGDFIEAGVFRGGFVVYMRALLAAFGDTSRSVFAADSFSGIPEGMTLGGGMDSMLLEADLASINQDEQIELDWVERYAAGKEVLRNNLRRFGLLDHRVQLVEGYFNETLPNNDRLGKLSLIRLDSDA